MPKQVRHDNLVWVRWGKKKRCRNKFGMTILCGLSVTKEEMLKRVQHDNEARVRWGKKVEKYEMLKRVQHDSLV